MAAAMVLPLFLAAVLSVGPAATSASFTSSRRSHRHGATAEGPGRGAKGHEVSLNAPEWCKNRTETTWAQRKAKLDAAEALKWVKKQVKMLQADNQEVPPWMDHIVNTDTKRGALKWAVQEASKLKGAGQEVPKWMMDVAEQDAYWGRRWAACRADELRDTGKEVPKWMQENEQRAIVEGAEADIKKYDAELDLLEARRASAKALIEAGGDLIRMKKAQVRAAEAAKRAAEYQKAIAKGGNEAAAAKRQAEFRKAAGEGDAEAAGVDQLTKARIAALDSALSELAAAKNSSKHYSSSAEKGQAVQAGLEKAGLAASRLATALGKEELAMTAAVEEVPVAQE